MKKLIAIALIFTLISCNEKIADYAAFKNAQDHNVPLFNDTISNKTALLVFPHPDDEITCGGTIAQLKKNGWTVNLLTLTQGAPDEKATRKAEWENATAVMKIDKHEILDLPNNSWDNVLNNTIVYWNDNMENIESIVYRYITLYKPSVVFTYDVALGGYGHPEHRLSAVAVKNIFEKHRNDPGFPVQKILQVTLPEKLEQLMLGGSKPYENAKKFTGNTTLPDPTLAFDIRKNWPVKYNGALQYTSQAASLEKFYLLPNVKDTLAHFSAFDREYFTEVKR